MKNKKVIRLTESELTRLVERVVNEAGRDYPVTRTVDNYKDFSKYSRNTKWGISSSMFDGVIETYGPLTVYISADDKIKIGCFGERCYDQTDRSVSKEEAAQMLGVSSLDDIRR